MFGRSMEAIVAISKFTFTMNIFYLSIPKGTSSVYTYSPPVTFRLNRIKKTIYLCVLGEYPTFSNGLSLPTDDGSSQVHQTTVNPIPVIWGPQKRNK